MIKRGYPERAVQVPLVDWLRMVLPRGWKVFAVKNEYQARSADPKARARFYAMRKAEGVVTGWPDLGCVDPKGRLYPIEVKAPGGIVSSDQQDRHEELALENGTVVGIVDSIESCRLHWHTLGIHLRETPGQLMRPAKVTYEKRKHRLVDDMALPF